MAIAIIRKTQMPPWNNKREGIFRWNVDYCRKKVAVCHMLL